MKARCWFEEEPRVDFIRNIAPWDADDLDADRSRGLRLDPERPLIKVLLMAASGRWLQYSLRPSMTASAAFESFIKLMLFFNGQEKAVRSHSPMNGALLAIDSNHP